ncbi:class V chitinase CHIT5a-like [Pyrus x bretschneideri]|uniref:class V chitinase CHIT5a-like n=1 Tax=Pyrus x bretschneideri TaxID=225117 RepID=UPI0005119FD3|nr:class V chitinase CHIT5a-like [Pyrus x bretschneideri]
MGTPKLMPFFILVICHTMLSSGSGSNSDHIYPSGKGIRAAYFPSSNSFSPSSIDTQYFTHIYYAFLQPESTTYKLNVTEFDKARIPEFIKALRSKNPPVTTLLSMGGGGNNATVFALMVSTQATREVFINSTIQVARKYGFQGLDLDWEFPQDALEMSNLALLYKEWRKALDNEARVCGKPCLLLTSAVYYASKFTFHGGPRSYPAGAISKYLDWASPMCFDYHGSWANFTGMNAALDDSKSNISTRYGIGSWIEAGVPSKKLVMGLPLYGRTWTLKDPKVNGIGAPALGVGPGDGVLVYHQVLNFNTRTNATVVYDTESASYYSYSGSSWVGYDGVRSANMKVRFAKSLGLGGYFFWALGQDNEWAISKQASNAWKY